MKNVYLILVFAIGIFAASCKKDPENTGCPYTPVNVVATEFERDSIRNYLDSNDITDVVEDNSGLFYKIHAPGAGTDSIDLCTILLVEYTGKFFNGQIFDATEPGQTADFQLGEVITGWQYSMPKLKAGGRMTLYVPPSLAYGSRDITNSNGQVIMPGNSYLMFDISLNQIIN